MPVIAEFKVIQFDEFANAPRGAGDPDFVLADPFDKTQMLTIVISDDDTAIDGDASVNESADDLGQTADVFTADGTLLYSNVPVYVEWRADYSNDADPADTIEMWRFELDQDFLPPGDNVRMFAVDKIPDPGASYSTSNKNMNPLDVVASDMDAVVCFAAGTRIQTPAGDVSIQDLVAGDLVCTYRNGDQPIRWIGCREFGADALAENPKLMPVKIMAGSLGLGHPATDLVVSRQHRMLVSSKIASRMFGQQDVLVSAIRLTALPGIYVDTTYSAVTYYHILFDAHQVVFANGAPSESLFTGPEALRIVPQETRDEIFAIFPELIVGANIREPAHMIPDTKRQRQLVQRHIKNQKAALQMFAASD